MRKLIAPCRASIDCNGADADNGMRGLMMSIGGDEQAENYVSQLWDADAFLIGPSPDESLAGFVLELVHVPANS